MPNFLCKACGDPVPSDDDDYTPYYCPNCEEIGIERAQKRAEWDAFHDEACPESELPKFK